MAAIIVAVDENNGIGFNGSLLASIPEDMKRFQQLTTEGGFVMMGRNTYDSLPKKPLINRQNYIITRDKTKVSEEFVHYIDMDEAKTLIRLADEIFTDTSLKMYIIGGAQIYKTLLPYCQEIYLTKICKDYKNVDTYFPMLPEDEWIGEMTSESIYNNLKY